jgi:hypothetical protein
MLASAPTGNISGEATIPPSNIRREATRQSVLAGLHNEYLLAPAKALIEYLRRKAPITRMGQAP